MGTWINFKVNRWDLTKPIYSLDVDGINRLEVPKGDLRKIVYEIEKYLRLVFKEDLR